MPDSAAFCVDEVRVLLHARKDIIDFAASYFDNFIQCQRTGGGEDRHVIVSEQIDSQSRQTGSNAVGMQTFIDNAAHYTLAPDGKTAIVDCSLDSQDLHILAMRCVRDMIKFALLEMGAISIHASCVILDGLGVALVAPKRGGKTSIALASALTQEDAFIVSNDEILTQIRGNRILARGLPVAIAIRESLAQQWPQLSSQWSRFREFSRDDDDELKMYLPVSALRLGCGCNVADRTILSALVCPSYSPLVSGARIQLLRRYEAEQHLRSQWNSQPFPHAPHWSWAYSCVRQSSPESITHMASVLPVFRLVHGPGGIRDAVDKLYQITRAL